MLKSTFIPILSIITTKPTSPKPSKTFTRAFSQSPPTVRKNVSHSPSTTTTTSPPPQNKLPPVSAYVHLPFCRKRCHYCDFPIVALGSSSPPPPEEDPRILNYTQLICREIEATKLDCHPIRPLETVFFGGGTPSLVPPRLVSDIVEALRLKFGVCLNAEMSMEMDPGTFDAEKLKGLMELGVNRVSLGVQAFQEEILRDCGRAHGVKEIYEAIEIVKSCGVENWSVDLISSLPHQTPEMWEESLRLVIEAQPTHVSVYDLQVEQGTKFGLLYTAGEFPLPSETQSADLYRMASTTLSNAGYNHYEISSYCKVGFECKHNLTYWENKPFYAFGLGSASYVGGVRFSRPRKMKDYMGYVMSLETGLVDCCCKELNNPVDAKDDDMAMDVVMLSLRTARGLDLKSFRNAFGDSFVASLCKAYRPYVETGHVVCLDEQRRPVAADEFSSFLLSSSSSSSKDGGIIEERLAFIRLSDPDGFLLSNELITVAFQAIAP